MLPMGSSQPGLLWGRCEWRGSNTPLGRDKQRHSKMGGGHRRGPSGCLGPRDYLAGSRPNTSAYLPHGTLNHATTSVCLRSLWQCLSRSLRVSPSCGLCSLSVPQRVTSSLCILLTAQYTSSDTTVRPPYARISLAKCGREHINLFAPASVFSNINI